MLLKPIIRAVPFSAIMLSGLTLVSHPASAELQNCRDVVAAAGGVNNLRTALVQALGGSGINSVSENGGLATAQWLSVVDRDGIVCAVVFSGSDRQSQWPASRVISMQKAYTANSLSLDSLALSTANLWSATQPGGSLFGLQFSNPVAPTDAYKGPAQNFGAGENDPAVGKRVGGVNVFGGGLALYTKTGVIGGIGTSGNTSCADHIITWKVRDILALDNVPNGVSPTGDDNIIFDLAGTPPVSVGGFGHPECGFGERAHAEALPTTNPIGSGN
jgi:uncharacterized protein GlcG (DUF336 family)